MNKIKVIKLEPVHSDHCSTKSAMLVFFATLLFTEICIMARCF